MIFKRYFFIFTAILILNNIFNKEFYIYKLNAEEKNNSLNLDYFKTKENNFYILGPGDSFELIVSEETDLLNSEYVINAEGYISPLRLNKIYVSGLTIEELKSLLNEAYMKYIKEPNVNLKIILYRNIKVFTEGELAYPGLYTLLGQQNVFDAENENKISSVENFLDNNQLINTSPTLFDAIRKSGGLTLDSDLSKIVVTRVNSISNGGGRIRAEINLLNLLESDWVSQNIRLYDGDKIYIPKSETNSTIQFSKAIKNNLNPKFINVYVSGLVKNEGLKSINRGSSLSDAIQVAGGTRILKGPIHLMRYNNDGTVEKNKFRFRPNSRRGSKNNPYLQNGDLVFVGRNVLSTSTELISEVTSPFQGLFSAYGLYKAISE